MADSEPTASAAASAPPVENLGLVLRNARLALDLTVEQIATELRIEVKHLVALEENRFEQIGVPVFVKGYLKQYGQRLGVDSRDLLALYYKQTTLPDVQIQPNRTIKLRDERQITSWVLAAVVLLAVAVGLAAWWWNGGTFDAFRPTPVSSSPPSAPAVPPVLAAPRSPPEPVAVTPPLPAPVDAGEPAREAAAVVLPAATEQRVEQPVAVNAEADALATPVVAIPLEFTFEAESWAEVTDARGERLLYGLNTAGRNVTVRGEPPFSVVLGNARSVRLAVDGAPYAIPFTSPQDNLARFSVDVAEE